MATKPKQRKNPGAGGGKFYRIEVKPKKEYKKIRTEDVGDKGHLERLAGKKEDGSWDTITWLISKEDAHLEGKKLIIDNPKAKSVLKQISGPIKHTKDDVFKASPRKNISKKQKPTLKTKARKPSKSK